MKRIVILWISLIALSATACSKATSGDYDSPPQGMVSIAYLKSLARGDNSLIVHDISIEGYVVANDLYGEFYKTIVISDKSGGIAISVDERQTAVRFPVSARVMVQCSGLAIGSHGGTLMLGAMPEREYTVERIAASDIERYISIDKENPQSVEPQRITIAELAPEHIGNYVVIDDLYFNEQAGMMWCAIDPLTGQHTTTERTAYDSANNSLAIRTIAQCDYRSEIIPAGRGALYGIVEYFNGKYSLRIVNHGIVFK